MKQFPKKLQSKIENRKEDNTFRQLAHKDDLIDFSSNDYLGFSKSEPIFKGSHQFLIDNQFIENGATGSRLLSGNHQLYTTIEKTLSEFHNSNAALIFNSGYNANLGLFASLPQKGDFIFYDELSHASIRDGISLSHAKSYKFKHNDLNNLKEKTTRFCSATSEVYIVTESVFSMDGDSPDLITLCEFCKQHNYHLIIDEAHAIGIFGNGKGLIQQLHLEHNVFARLITFGKALGCHGAAILGNNQLKTYLINFARSFIYTTALPPHTLATINFAYKELKKTQHIKTLHQNIQFFKYEMIRLKLQHKFIESDSAIQSCIISGSDTVKSIASQLKENLFDIKPILSPTVAKSKERLRFCLHSFNTKKEITKVLELLSNFTTNIS